MRLVRFSLTFIAALGLGACSLVVDFDRSLLRDGGGVDASVDAGADGAIDEEENAAVDGNADAG